MPTERLEIHSKNFLPACSCCLSIPPPRLKPTHTCRHQLADSTQCKPPVQAKVDPEYATLKWVQGHQVRSKDPCALFAPSFYTDRANASTFDFNSQRAWAPAYLCAESQPRTPPLSLS